MTNLIEELPGKNLTEFSAFELEVLLNAIRYRSASLNNQDSEEIIDILTMWRTKVLEAKILVLQREKVLNG